MVDGGDGADSLKATISATDSYDVSSVEALDIKVTAAATIDMADFTGEETLRVNGTGATTLSNYSASVPLTSAMSGTATIDLSLDDATGTTDEVTLNLDSATSTGLTTIDDVETINIVGSNDNDSLSLDGDAVSTLNISGSNDLNIVTPVGALLTTIDAAAMTGDLTLGVTANNIAVTTGSGDDTVTMAAASLTNRDSVDLGEGSNTLILTAAANAYASVAATTTLDVSNVTNLALVAGAADDAIDFDLFADPTQFSAIAITTTADAADITLTDIQTSIVSLQNTNAAAAADAMDAFVYDLKDSTGTADAATFVLTNRDVDGDFVIDDFTAAGIETITFSTAGGTDGDITITNLTATSAESITIAGDADFTLPAFATTVETVSGATGSGDLDLTFAGADVEVTGGSGADTFNFGTSFTSDDVVDGGDGTDTVTVGAINDGAVINMDVDFSNVERFTITETNGSDEDATFDFNGEVISRFTVTLEATDNHVIAFEDVGAGAITLVLAGTGEADGDTVSIDRSSDSSSDAVAVRLTADNGEAVFEGTITLNDEETITFDTTGADAASAVTIADLDASDATSVTFTNDDAWDSGDIFALTANSIRNGATINFAGYNQSIGDAGAAVDVASAAEAAGTGSLTDAATALGTAGFTAVANRGYTILLGDGRTEDADVETSINLGAANTVADVIRFVDSTEDSTNDIGVVVIDNFNNAANSIVTHRSQIDLSAFGIEGVADLTIAAGELDDGEDVTVISAATATDFAGTITLLGTTATDISAADFIFSI